MNNRKKTCKAVSLLLSGMLLCAMPVSSEAAVITSNATDKIAVVFNEHTDYSAGDYVTYDGEMYICISDIQGTWDTAQAGFMQITKNKEIGNTSDLSASYAPTVDPSEEKSVMAFAANVWQKLKVFFGMDQKDADTDAGNYKHASVSAKLNYLEQQNQELKQNLDQLQGSVNQSFQFVSSGKSMLAGAITDVGGSAGPQDSFQQFSQSVKDLAQAKYNQGYHDGQKDGYQSGYDDGIDFADSRVNEDSESYKQALSQNHTKVWSLTTRITYDGPQDGAENFIREEFSEGHPFWSFQKSFEGHQILGVYATRDYNSPFSRMKNKDIMLSIDGSYHQVSSEDSSSLSVVNSTVTYGLATFNSSIETATVEMTIKIVYI